MKTFYLHKVVFLLSHRFRKVYPSFLYFILSFCGQRPKTKKYKENITELIFFRNYVREPATINGFLKISSDINSLCLPFPLHFLAKEKESKTDDETRKTYFLVFF
jgi:hypothetical protein